MTLDVREGRIERVLTRTTGYLRHVCSHSLQPYRGCSYGRSLCGAYCYVQHNAHLLRGEPWGGFLEVRVNAAESYRAHFARERRFAHGRDEAFAIFLSSATDPFVPQERRYGITRQVLEAMCELPPDALILQTHSHRVTDALGLLGELSQRTDLRVHVTVESDRDRLPGLPPPASSVARRLAAARALRDAGLRVAITVSPLLPIASPENFFRDLGAAADWVVIDHFIGGDGSRAGARTRRTPVPAAMDAVLPGSSQLDYRERMVAVAKRILPGRVGVGADGFAGRLLPVE